MEEQAPLVRVELEYADGSIQRLVGPPAEQWLKEMNDVIASTHIRYSRAPVTSFPWQWVYKDGDDPRHRFLDNYEGTD